MDHPPIHIICLLTGKLISHCSNHKFSNLSSNWDPMQKRLQGKVTFFLCAFLAPTQLFPGLRRPPVFLPKSDRSLLPAVWFALGLFVLRQCRQTVFFLWSAEETGIGKGSPFGCYWCCGNIIIPTGESQTTIASSSAAKYINIKQT